MRLRRSLRRDDESCSAAIREDAGLDLLAIARIADLEPLRLPPEMEPRLEALRAYEPPAMTYSNAAHLSEREPADRRGQQHGAVALGLSGALPEAVVYDPPDGVTTRKSATAHGLLYYGVKSTKKPLAGPLGTTIPHSVSVTTGGRPDRPGFLG